MIKYLFITSILFSFSVMAEKPNDVKDFEINKENCNLPMKEIRKLLPDPADQKNATKQCVEKSVKERWKKN